MAVMKHSRQREAIKANLMQRRDHPTADMIYADIREEFPNISLGTVYRNLSLLTDLGEVRKLTEEGGPDHYDGNTEPHMHFFCRKCGAIADLPSMDCTKFTECASKSLDGVIEESRISFIGVCGQCERKAQAGKRNHRKFN